MYKRIPIFPSHLHTLFHRPPQGKNYYQQIVRQLKPTVTSVVVVGWDHHHHDEAEQKVTLGFMSGENVSHSRSEEYRDDVVRLFEESGRNVTHRWEGTPDEDFVFIGSARHVVPGGGGFHSLAAHCARENGGRLYDPGDLSMKWMHDGHGR